MSGTSASGPEPADVNGDSAPVIVLVGTQLGENIGTTARAMMNFGLTDLRLVRPKCGWPNVKALQACSGAVEVLNRLRQFDNVGEATADLHLVLATTARPRDLPKPVLTAREAGRELCAASAGGRRAGLLFGPERTGLSNDHLIYADAVLRVPVNPAYSSLNLAQAVLLVGYEWFQASYDPSPRQPEPPGPRPATKGELAGLLAHLVNELDQTRFFRTGDRRQSMVQSLTLVVQRANLREPDVHLLRGVIKALAAGKRTEPRIKADDGDKTH